MEGGRRGQLIDCAECWRLEERGMRIGGKGKENRGLNPSLQGRKREEGIDMQRQKREVEKISKRGKREKKEATK